METCRKCSYYWDDLKYCTLKQVFIIWTEVICSIDCNDFNKIKIDMDYDYENPIIRSI